MPLLEIEVQRFASALDDYEDLSVVDIGGTDHAGYWLVVQDGRTDARSEIRSRLDYWNVVSGLARSLRAASSPAGPPAVGPASQAATSSVVGGAIGRPSGAAISASEATA